MKIILNSLEKQRIRKNYRKSTFHQPIPYLLSTPIKEFKLFIDNQASDNIDSIKFILNSYFPIKHINKILEIQFISYKIGCPEFNVKECQEKGLTFSVSLTGIFRLFFFKNNKKNKLTRIIKKLNKDFIEQEVYLGEIPLMTDNGTFIINGTERVIVTQLQRCPGIIFNAVHSLTSSKILYNAKIIPSKGAWLEFEFDLKDLIFVRLNRKKKLLVTILLKALKYSTEEILKLFFVTETIYLKQSKIIIELDYKRLHGEICTFNIIKNNIIYIPKGKLITNKDIQILEDNKIVKVEVPKEYLINKIVYKNYINVNTGELICLANTKLTDDLINKLINANIPIIETLFINDVDHGNYISKCLELDNTKDYTSALKIIYKILKPGEEFIKTIAENYLRNLFFSNKYFDLTSVGRLKINQSLNNLGEKINKLVLTRTDIIKILQKLINIKNGIASTDDIDHLGNRRIKSLSEMLANYFRLGVFRLTKLVQEKINNINHLKNIQLQDLFNSKLLSIIMKEFFTSSQLSQFMDQTNPLAEITHKRRISVLGPGGLTRERANFEIRDVHPSHYGRMCPVETPEGPNIGLITSLAIYAKINKHGFLVTPYRQVINGKITNQIKYLSPNEEYNYRIAQANTKVSQQGNIVENLIVCRYNGETSLFSHAQVDFVDVSSQQILSIGAALIPFIEHDDANRALMGTNMQRQAVPLIHLEKPLVGTGSEQLIATDAGGNIIAKRGGLIQYLDADKIMIKVNDNELTHDGEIDSGIDIYYLTKYVRSNQNTCINQKVCINLFDLVKAGDIIATGTAIDLGELALGHNVRVAFMPWYGYNFEDAIVISEKLIHDNKFTSIHIQELTCIVRDTKLGLEKLTNKLPNISDNIILKINNNGLIDIGTIVKEGDIIVGKVTPQTEIILSPEDKLLYAIFGEKIASVKDSSLRVPLGVEGTVIDIQILTRTGLKPDLAALRLQKIAINKVKEEAKVQLDIISNHFLKMINPLLNEKIQDFNIQAIINNQLQILTLNNNLNQQQINSYLADYKLIKSTIINKLKLKIKKINKNTDLPPGILKIVKIFIATKRQLQPGDKMAGRHGNKGVVSKICPIEDMPYDEFGHPIDIVLNPLGVPSRMNIGQILETHLGLAAKGIGKVINKMLTSHESINQIKEFLNKIYNQNNIQQIDFNSFKNSEILKLAKNLCDGLPIATPAFDGITETEIKSLLKLANLPISGQIKLFDGCTGTPIIRPVTVGYMYMLKLNHLVEDKIHARSTGAYSLVTQQPLGGKAQFGGQRFGEMEVWALEAYGAAHILQEMLTVKSDDVLGRNKIYQNIINEKFYMQPGIPESFNVLMKEIKALGLNIELISKANHKSKNQE